MREKPCECNIVEEKEGKKLQDEQLTKTELLTDLLSLRSSVFEATQSNAQIVNSSSQLFCSLFLVYTLLVKLCRKEKNKRKRNSNFPSCYC